MVSRPIPLSVPCRRIRCISQDISCGRAASAASPRNALFLCTPRICARARSNPSSYLLLTKIMMPPGAALSIQNVDCAPLRGSAELTQRQDCGFTSSQGTDGHSTFSVKHRRVKQWYFRSTTGSLKSCDHVLAHGIFFVMRLARQALFHRAELTRIRIQLLVDRVDPVAVMKS